MGLWYDMAGKKSEVYSDAQQSKKVQKLIYPVFTVKATIGLWIKPDPFTGGVQHKHTQMCFTFNL